MRMLRQALVTIALALLVTVTAAAESGDFTPQVGDLLFQDLDGSPLCDAIETVTQGVGGARLSHVGMVTEAADGNVTVIEAVSAGVVETPLDKFLARSSDANGAPKVLVGRLKPEYRHLIPKAVDAVRGYLGRPYDSPFRMDDSALYCSELIYDAFNQAQGSPLFPLAPMTFNDPATQAPFPAWVEYYAKLGEPIPEGEPGLNPGGMSSSPTLDIVHAYGQPEGWNSASLHQDTPMKLTVMTYNIRFDNPRDGEDRWELRRDKFLDTVRKADPDIFGTQEALASQVGDIAKGLPEYGWVGMDRDANGRGEFMAVFYRRSRFGVVDSGTFWLSQTPHVPATKSWDSACNRTVTWLHLVDYETGRQFHFYNTHLDHASDPARVEGAKLIAQKIAANSAHVPVILTGDFNCQGGESPVWHTLCTDLLRDSRLVAARVDGPDGTFTGFDPQAPERNARIDWILVSKGIDVASCETIHQPQGERRASDHRPVVARLTIAD